MLGAILAAGFGSLLMSNPRRKRRRRRNPETPVKRSPGAYSYRGWKIVRQGHRSSWRMIDPRGDLLIDPDGNLMQVGTLARAVQAIDEHVGPRSNPKTAHPVGRCDACGQTMSRTHHLKKGGYNAAREIDREADRDHKPFSRELGSRRQNPSTEVTELVLFITNDGDLYRQQAQPIIKNLRKKIAKGTYDAAKAVKLWGYLANSGAQKYTKEFGGSGNGSYGSFSAADRRAAAKELADSYEEELRSTNPRRGKKSRRWARLHVSAPSNRAVVRIQRQLDKASRHGGRRSRRR